MVGTIFNVDVFLNNLELLRRLSKKSKGEFATMIGVANAFRRDLESLGTKMERGITDNFRGVDREWLLRDHPEGIGNVRFTPREECQTEKDAQAKPPAESGLLMVWMAGKVLESGTIYGKALQQNIEAFYQAVQKEKDLKTEETPSKTPGGTGSTTAASGCRVFQFPLTAVRSSTLPAFHEPRERGR